MGRPRAPRERQSVGRRDLSVRKLGAPHRDPASAALLVTLVATAVFANSLLNQFAYDDYHIVEQNTAIQSLETLPGAVVSPYWPNAYGRELGLWRPVTTAALGLQWIVAGGSPVLFHTVNVLAHVAASALVLVLLMHLMSLPAALAAALVFAVHPVHVEAVANVVGFSEVFSTFALIAACVVHVRGPDRTSWGGALLLGALYALGFGAKESAVTLPALVFLLDAARPTDRRCGRPPLRRRALARLRRHGDGPQPRCWRVATRCSGASRTLSRRWVPAS